MALRRALGWAGSCALPVPFGGRAASTGSERARARLRQALETEGSPQTLRDFIPAASSSPSAPFAAGAGTDEAPYSVSAPKKEGRQRKPEWLKRSVPGGENYMHIKNKLRGLGLSTVCEEAKCPNIGECWGGTDGTATATIMIMGDTCTRACRFCAVKTSNAPPALDEHEPQKVADAISAWGLDYVVFTSVDRDDLPDYGSGHISKCVEEVKMRSPEMLVEVLSPDFSGDEEGVDRVIDSGVDVFAHNVETVEELQSVVRDRRAGWDRSIRALERAKENGAPVTKTSLMLGVGETPEQIYSCLTKLRESGVDVVTFGQYMRPSKKHMRVAEYVTPAAFEHWKQVAEQMGFKYVASGPMVRSSYRAGEYFIKNILQGDRSAANVAQPKRKRVAAGA